MLESDLQRVCTQQPERSLSGLEHDVWQSLARSERRRAWAALGGAQLLVLLAALLAGRASQRAQLHADALGVFSTHPPLAVSTLLANADE